VHPRVTIWFHQPLGVTDLSGGDPRLERRFAARSRLPARLLTRYPGSAPTWQNRRFRGTTAFVVELPRRVGPAAVARYAAAARAVSRLTGDRASFGLLLRAAWSSQADVRLVPHPLS
jgi:protein MpaA